MHASRPTLLLAGCGHAHLFVLEALARGRFSPVRAILVSPDEAYAYSGLVSAVVMGARRPEEAIFHPARLAAAAGVEWVRDAVVSVDAEARVVMTRGGRTLPYDLLSFDVGTGLAAREIAGYAEHGIGVKPARRALDLGLAAERAVAEAGGRRARIVFVGGGAAGVEVALGMARRLDDRVGADAFAITILEAGPQLVAEYVPRARRLAREAVEARRIGVRTEARVERAEADALVLEGGERVPYDLLVWATGPGRHDLFRDAGLPTDERGYLRVNRTLAVDGHADLFGAGDCVSLIGAEWVAKAGVYAVREGPVLAANLARRLRGERLRTYRPQRHWLSLLNTADGRAVMSYRGIGLRGAWLLRLKDRLDLSFVRRFLRLARPPVDG